MSHRQQSSSSSSRHHDDRRHEDSRHKRSRRRSRSRSRSRPRERDKVKERDRSDAKREKVESSQTVVSATVARDESVPSQSAAAVTTGQVDEEEEMRLILQKILDEEEAQRKEALALEESRKRREAIMAKYATNNTAEKPGAQPSQAPPPAAAAAVVVAPRPPEPAIGATKAREEDEKREEGSNDDDDVFDMFTDAPEAAVAAMDDKGVNKALLAQTEIRTDAEGYGSITAGRVLGGRYQVIGEAGKGVFSTVVRCTDMQQGGAEVVVKVARLNEAMKRAGRKEIEYLRLLTKRDPDNKYCTLRMLDSFEDQDFLCVVLEAMDISLRETVYLYGQGEGLSLAAVRYYGKRVLMALYHMKQCGLVHTDLKLDNLLVDKQRKVLKVADFGSTRRVTEFIKGKAEELCPLWYRPPEVIVGFPYMSYSLDMWCFGNILFELATGTVLFQGNNLNEQLFMYIEMFGVLPRKMVRTAESYFYNGDPTKFLQMHIDSVTSRPVISIVDVSREPHLSLKDRLFEFFPDAYGDDKKQVVLLHDLMEKCLALNPRKRLGVDEALQHPFFAALASK